MAKVKNYKPINITLHYINVTFHENLSWGSTVVMGVTHWEVI